MNPKGWNISKLREWLSRTLTQEDDNFDLKEKIPNDGVGKYRLKKEFCGYANKSGGYIFFGIKNDKTIVGIDEDHEFTTKVSQIITTHVSPPTIEWKLYECIPLEEQGKYVYIIKIFESIFSKKPHVLYVSSKGLCVPLREHGHLRDITDGAEIRRIFLNSHGYYPEYNVHVIEILRQVKTKSVPDFSLNERIIIQAFKSHLRSGTNDQNTQMINGIEAIEDRIANTNKLLINGSTEGQSTSTGTVNQVLEQMVDNYISEFGAQIL